MKSRPNSAFNYNFRASDCKVQGPIRYAVGQTVQGVLLIGKSQQGICAIFLGEDARVLRDQLAVAFPHLELKEDQQSLLRELDQIISFIDKDIADDVVDLDIGGTPFQQEVWQALCGIPAGQTRSYGEIAHHIGVPDAARAVAGACGANMLAIAIPCHRVVSGDGAISGYRWGVDRKRALLAEEIAQ